MRSKLPKKPNGALDQARLDAMFDEIERYLPLDWALTLTPLGPSAPPQDVEALAKQLEPDSDFDVPTLIGLIHRENEDPILLAKNYTRAEVNARRVFRACGTNLRTYRASPSCGMRNGFPRGIASRTLTSQRL